MKFGCCTNMIALNSDGIGIERATLLKELGFEYLELPLSQIMNLNNTEFDKLLKRIISTGLTCEVLNLCFPDTIKLTGNNVNDSGIRAYIEESLNRSAQLGVEIIIFGSSGARNISQGFSTKRAWWQIVEMLKQFSDLAKPYGITVAIEPLNQGESNIINSTLDGLQMTKDVGRENIKLLVDYYHWALEKEDVNVIFAASEYIRHIHFSRPEGRVFPRSTDPDLAQYKAFFNNLINIGYNGRISVEAYTKNLEEDSKMYWVLIKKMFNSIYGSKKL